MNDDKFIKCGNCGRITTVESFKELGNKCPYCSAKGTGHNQLDPRILIPDVNERDARRL